MKITEVRRYRIYETPNACRYQLEDSLDIDVVWDDGYWLASPSHPCKNDRFGTGDSIKKAIRDLIEIMVEDYQLDIKYLKRHPKGTPSCNYMDNTKLFYKK